MSVESRTDLEPREQHGRKACIDFSLRTFSPLVWSQMGSRGFEERFLEGEFSRDDRGDLIIPSVQKKVKKRVWALRARNVLRLSDRQLTTMEESIGQERNNLGIAIKEKAERGGLVSSQTTEQVAETLGGVVRMPVEDDFSFRKWKILPTQDGSFTFVTPQISDDNNTNFDVFSMDSLYQQDPKFVKEKVRRFYELQGLEQAINGVTYNLALHKVDERSLVPGSINELSTDQKRMEQEMDGYIAFLRFFGGLTDYPTRLVDDFVRELRQGNQPLPGEEQRFVNLATYFDHIIDCPREPDATRHEATLREYAFNRLSTLELTPLERPNPDDQSSAAEQIRLLMHPLSYTEVEINKDRERLRGQKERDTNIGQFIRETRDVMDRAEFTRVLEEKLPTTFSLLQRFMQGAGEGYSGQTGFDRFIERATRMVIREGKTPDQAVLESLSSMYFVSDNIPEVRVDSQGARIFDPDLRFLLPYMVLKSVQENVEDRNPINERIHALAEQYEERVHTADAKFFELQQRDELMKAMMSHYNIPRELINQLALSVQPAEEERDPNYTAFAFAFSALVLSEYLDRTTLAFRALAKEVYPAIKDEILDILQGRT